MRIRPKTAAAMDAAVIFAGTALIQTTRAEPEAVAIIAFAGAAGFIAGHLACIPFERT